MFLKKKKCKCCFYIEDIELTNYAPLEKPKHGEGYGAWKRYYSEIYKHRSHTQRVRCPCFKCGEVRFAHCGLDLGSLRRR